MNMIGILPRVLAICLVASMTWAESSAGSTMNGTTGGSLLLTTSPAAGIPPSQVARINRNTFLTLGLISAGVTGACILTGALIDADATGQLGAYQSSSVTTEATSLGNTITGKLDTANGFFVAAESGLLLTAAFGVVALVEHLRSQKLAQAEREQLKFYAVVLPKQAHLGMEMRF